jgi:hypothetical protein
MLHTLHMLHMMLLLNSLLVLYMRLVMDVTHRHQPVSSAVQV